MKKKNLLIVALSSLMSLVSCGGAGATVVDQTLPEDDPTSEVTINFWHCLGHEKTKNLTSIVNTFNTQYAGKYKVVLKHPAGDYDALHSVVKTKISSGEVPALTMGYPDSFSEYMTSRIEDSFLLRLDNFIKDEKFGYSQQEINDFVQGYYNEGTNYQFDGTWSMPMYKSTEVVYYNYSYFSGVNPLNAKKYESNAEFMQLYNTANGRTLENDDGTLSGDLEAVRAWLTNPAHEGYVYDVPETWDQAIALARQMKADRAEMEITDEFYPFGYDSDANLLISQMAQRGIEYTVNDEESKTNPRKHFKFVNDDAKALVNEIIGYLNERIMITKNSLGGSTYTNTYFNEGKCAFTVGSTGGSSYNISSNFAVKLAPVPYKGVRKYIQQGPSICFFDVGNKYIHKGAWLFYKALADSSNNAKLALENSYDPIRTSSYSTSEYGAWIANEGQGLKYDIPAMTARLKEYYMTSPVFIGSSTARTEIGMIINYIYASKYSTDAAFSKAYDACVTAAK